MPGIYGFVVNNDQPAGQLGKMTKLLNHHTHFIKEDDFITDNFAASHLHLGNMKKEQNVFNKNGIYISIEGEQYDFPESSFEELLFDAYSSNQLDSFLNKLDGYFNAVIYDANTNKVNIISDRYGMRMLYFYNKDGNFAFSGEVKGLVGLDFVDAEIDTKQFDVFMDLGYLLEDNTWHKHIKLIKPASILEFDINTQTLSHRYYWKWSEIKPSNLSLDEAVDKLGHLWIEAVRKRFNLKEKIGVALSGGLDSRAIFAALHHLYPDFEGYAYTFGVPDCDDMIIAKACIEQTKWKHKEFYFTSDNWFEPRKERVWFTDGMQNMMHMHGSEFLEEVKEKSAFNISGVMGDIVFRFSSLQTRPWAWNARVDKSIADRIYKNHSSDNWINDDFYNIQNTEPFLLMNDARRFSNMGQVNGQSEIDVKMPFMDNKVLELIYSLPDEYRSENKLYSAMLLKFFPQFFKTIPWQNTRKNIDGTESDLLKKEGFIRSYMTYASAIREPTVLKLISEILEYSASSYKNITDTDAIKEYLEPHLNNLKVNHIEKIFRFLTLELYLRHINAKTKSIT